MNRIAAQWAALPKPRRRAATGFSLIELLIVVAIILIIAAIAIPNLVRSKIAANEASAVSSVRTITTAETTYTTTWGVGYAPDLPSLGGVAIPCVPSAASACLIDSMLTGGAKSGYTFTAAGNTSMGGVDEGFETNATPIVVGTTGQRAFCSDQTGVIRYNTTGVAIGTGAATCGTLAATLVGN